MLVIGSARREVKEGEAERCPLKPRAVALVISGCDQRHEISPRMRRGHVDRFASDPRDGQTVLKSCFEYLLKNVYVVLPHSRALSNQKWLYMRVHKWASPYAPEVATRTLCLSGGSFVVLLGLSPAYPGLPVWPELQREPSCRGCKCLTERWKSKQHYSMERRGS